MVKKYAIALLSLALLSLAMTPGSHGEKLNVMPASAEIKNMTFYFHNESTSQYVFDYSTTYIFNTILGSKQESIGRWGSVVVDFYLFPTLAGNITISGNISVVFYMNMSATSNNFNGNFGAWLYDVSYIAADGRETSTLIANAQVSLVFTTNRAAYGVTMQGINYTVEKGHGLRARVSLSGGASNYYFLWFGTGNWDSRIVIQTKDSIEVERIRLYDAHKNETNWFSPLAENKTIVVQANITDPYGGYDIYEVLLTVKDEAGNPMPGLENCTMWRILGNNKSFLSVYEYSFNYSSFAPGKYEAVVWALDLNGYYYYTHYQQFDYGPYPAQSSLYFFIGGYPQNVLFRCLDTNEKPLRNATVLASFNNNVVARNTTDSDGNTNLLLFAGNYTISVYYEAVLVAENLTEIAENFTGALVIHCLVYSVEFKVVTNEGFALEYALLFLKKPSGEILEFKAEQSGIVSSSLLSQLPVGNYTARIMWKGIEVGVQEVYIDRNSPPAYVLTTQVYTVRLRAVDSRGVGLENAVIIGQDNKTAFVMDYSISDENGSAVLRLPLSTIGISVYWQGVLVYSEKHLTSEIYNATTLNCSVYYVKVSVCDASAKVLPGAVCKAKGNLSQTNITDSNGIAIFRLPAGNYSLEVSWTGTQDMTPVSAGAEIEIEVSSDLERTVYLSSLPIPFFSTNLALMLLLLLVLIIPYIAIIARAIRKRKARRN